MRIRMLIALVLGVCLLATGCATVPAQVEETEDPLEVVVSFPGVEGIPAGFEQTKARIEEILPCHLLVKYQFSDSV